MTAAILRFPRATKPLPFWIAERIEREIDAAVEQVVLARFNDRLTYTEDRLARRAAVEAGYLPLNEYVRAFGDGPPSDCAYPDNAA